MLSSFDALPDWVDSVATALSDINVMGPRGACEYIDKNRHGLETLLHLNFGQLQKDGDEIAPIIMEMGNQLFAQLPRGGGSDTHQNQIRRILYIIAMQAEQFHRFLEASGIEDTLQTYFEPMTIRNGNPSDVGERNKPEILAQMVLDYALYQHEIDGSDINVNRMIMRMRGAEELRVVYTKAQQREHEKRQGLYTLTGITQQDKLEPVKIGNHSIPLNEKALNITKVKMEIVAWNNKVHSVPMAICTDAMRNAAYDIIVMPTDFTAGIPRNTGV